MYRNDDSDDNFQDENNWKAWEKILTDRNFREMFQQYLVPVATVQFVARSTAPDGWLICNGAAISRTVYADLSECAVKLRRSRRRYKARTAKQS